MPLSIPPELKKITPYIRRAEELDKDKINPESRLVAYYCRQYAVHIGIPLATSPTGKGCLGEMLGALEGEKTAMNSFTRDESKFLCSKFAGKIFDKADAEDRAGTAGKGTAKTFYAAASFLEMLQQFYQDDDDSEEAAEIKKKAVYSKWKATDILKAIKEGREPTPGGYGEDGGNMDMEETEKEETNAMPTAAGLPKVETSSDDGANEIPEPEPEYSPVLPPPAQDEGEFDDEGTEVALGPPPSFPEAGDVPPPPMPATAPRPPLTFSPPEPVPPPAMPAPKKSNSIFGFGKKKKKATKAEIADAAELTRFALSALEDKDADLAADRLKQALHALGR